MNQLFVEQRLPISDITGEVGAHGTSDVVIVAGDELIVVDLKYGRGVEVAADNNPQLQIYALAALRQFSLAQDFKTVRMVIHQPRLNSVSEWVQTVEELEAFAVAVAEGAAATRLPNAPLVPSEKGCKFCRAKATCPALTAKVQEAVGADFDDLTNSNQIAKELGGHSELHLGLDRPDDLARKMAVVDLIEGWCKSLRAETERRLLAGTAVPGYKLVQGKRGNRQWANKDDAEALLKSMRVPHDKMYDYSVVSPTTAEKLAKAEVIGPRQWPRVQALITQSEGQPSVAPESDKRPALVLDVTADFADLTTSPSDLT